MKNWQASIIGIRQALVVCLVLLGVRGLLSPVAAQDEPRTGFFSYLPAAPKLSLPDIDITPFWTDDLKRAKNAYSDRRFDKALKYFRRASDDGNIVADWYLGHMYQDGLGVPQDDATAYSYYQRVSDHFDPDEPDKNKLRIMIDSQVRLADYSREGIASANIAVDYQAAANRYLKIATTYGHPAAFYGLGVMNINGQGVNRNPRQGLKWMAAAARKRYAPAEAFLGDAYWTGRLVAQDRTRGLMWYILAMQSTDTDSSPDIGKRYKELLGQVSEDQRLEAEARAKVWNSQYPIDDSGMGN